MSKEPAAVFITAETLFDRVGRQAVRIPLVCQLSGEVRAWEIHGKNGPWLMTVQDHAAYLELCSCSLSPN